MKGFRNLEILEFRDLGIKGLGGLGIKRIRELEIL